MTHKHCFLLLFGLISLSLMSCNNHKTNQESNPSVLEAGMGEIIINSQSLSYEVGEGDGTPCIIPGFINLYDKAISDKLKSKFKFIYFESRAFYGDTIADNTLTMDSLVDDIELLRKELKLNEVAVLGHSILGLLAFEYGRKYPENTSHIIAVGSPSYAYDSAFFAITNTYWINNSSESRKQALKEKTTLMQDTIANTPESPYNSRWVVDYIATSAMIWHDYNYDCSWLVKDFRPVSNASMLNLFAITTGYHVNSSDKKITPPTYLALGKFDFLVPPILWDSVHYNAFDNLTVKRFDKSGHWPWYEEQESFDNSIIEWLQSIDKVANTK